MSSKNIMQVMQGECLSPTLFAAYINEIERLMNDVDEMGVYLNGVKVTVIMHTDIIMDGNILRYHYGW